MPFGHLGDGNIHYNVAQPVDADKAAFLERWHDVNMVVFDVVLKYGGSISAEHGIGIMKRDLLADHQGPDRDGVDARDQTHARSERDFESGEGLSLVREAEGATAGRSVATRCFARSGCCENRPPSLPSPTPMSRTSRCGSAAA